MANTYTQLYIHVVCVVKHRSNLMDPSWRPELYKYITGIVTNKQQKLMVINGVADHVHILLGLRPDCSPSDIVRDLKANSSRWINEQGHVSGRFEWQSGYGAFSVSKSQVKRVANYIMRQEEHHRKTTFREEYVAFLKAHNIDFLPEYIFEDYGAAPLGLGPY
jgi:REP element-mobilizing transposase RayT